MRLGGAGVDTEDLGGQEGQVLVLVFASCVRVPPDLFLETVRNVRVGLPLGQSGTKWE